MRAYELREIEKVATLHTGVHSTNGGLTRQVTTAYSISELFDFVNNFDKKISIKHVNEHFVDKNTCEPKVFYLSKSAYYDFVEGVRVYENKSDIKSGEVVPVYVSSVTAGNVVPPQIQSDGSVIVHDGGQIKAVDNIGTFDRQTKKVRYSCKADSEGDIITDEILKLIGEDWEFFQAKKSAENKAKAERARKLREQYFPGLDNGKFFAAIAKMTKDKVYSSI